MDCANVENDIKDTNSMGRASEEKWLNQTTLKVMNQMNVKRKEKVILMQFIKKNITFRKVLIKRLVFRFQVCKTKLPKKSVEIKHMVEEKVKSM